MIKAYNQLNNEDKQCIIDFYYNKKNKKKSFKEMANELSVSERAFSRVLKESGINTKLKNRYTLNDNYFERIDTERKAYWLGLIYADGYVGDEHFNNIVISLTASDISLIEQFAADIEFTGEIRIDKNGGGYSNGTPKAVLNFSSIKMASDLRNIGLYPGKSQSMDSLPNIDSNLMPHFIRGYFDGDGSISIHKCREWDRVKYRERIRVVFSLLGAKPFIDEIIELFPVKLTSLKCKSENMKYAICSAKSRILDVYEYLYKDATIYLNRKYEKWCLINGGLDKKLSKEKQGELLEAATCEEVISSLATEVDLSM